MKPHSFLALDLGAGSGRAILGRIRDGSFELKEVHRFPNTMVRLPDGLHWNTISLFEQCLEGIRKAIEASEGNLASLGIDTWGVDYALLGERDELLGLPFAYRDSRTEGVWESWSQPDRELIYRETGIQFMPFNTLVQMVAESRQGAATWKSARTFLNTPDLLNFWLTGEKRSEFTIASTTQMVDPSRREWSRAVLDWAGFSPSLFCPVAMPGERLGEARNQRSGRYQKTGVDVVLVGSHDTASAEAVVPALGDDHAWISAGTWSIMGMTLAQPNRSAAALASNMTNEGSVEGRSRFSRNITGLWLVQECQRIWGMDISEAASLAEEAPSPGAWVNSTQPEFMLPDSMPDLLADWCAGTGQPRLGSKADILRCAYESIALGHASCLQDIVGLTGRRPKAIHLVGGGSQSRLLCQLTSDMTGLPVVAGPVEATSLGNIAVQMASMGEIGSLAEARQMIMESGMTKTYEPKPERDWAAVLKNAPKSR